MKFKIIGLSTFIGVIVGTVLSLAQTYAYSKSYYFSLSTEALFPIVLGLLLVIINLKNKYTISLTISLSAGIVGIVFKGISHAIGYRYGVGSGAFYDGLTIPLMYAFLIGQVIILLIVVLIW